MRHLLSTSKLFKAVYVALALALLVNVLQPALALAAPRGPARGADIMQAAASAAVAPPTASIRPLTAGANCSVYPIALHTSSIAGKSAGNPLGDIYNGGAPGNFGWLSWTGDPSEPALAASLTPPGNSGTYVDPNDSNNHTLSIGDWVDGRPGVSNSGAVRVALTSSNPRTLPYRSGIRRRATATPASITSSASRSSSSPPSNYRARIASRRVTTAARPAARRPRHHPAHR